MVQIEISNDFGYVIFTGIASVVLVTYLGIKVGGARRRAGVPYPHAYASIEECEKDEKKMIFNCYQRAHQNTLELYPGFLVTLFASGIKYPVLASIGGGVWLLGRLLYAWGYHTGEPKKRTRGAIGYVGTLILLGSSIATGMSVLRS